MSIRKYAPRVLAVVLSMTIICSVIGFAAYTAGAEKSSVQKPSANASEGDTTTSSSSGKLTKEETVYVIADAKGEAKKVIVSDWVKNPEKLDSIDDKSDLKDIKNLKGKETYELDKDNMLVWDAKGKDIYYQGTSENDVPVDLSVSYELDGRAVSPENLAGKSGRLTMRFDYKNNKYETAVIDGKEEKIYVPFVMLTGMLLDNDKFSNVEVSNGKVINDGSHTIVAGFALPGMNESLGLDTDEFDIPSSVEITADVKNFELTTTLTLATNDVFNDIDTDKLDEKFDELNDKLNKLTEATDKLIDGSSQLYKGIHTLLKKSDTLVEGVKSLAAGAKKLSGGVSDLDAGAGKLEKGTKKLNKGAKGLSDGAVSLDGGVSELENGINQLSTGLSTLSSNSENLRDGAKKVFNSLLSTADSQLKAAGLEVEKLTIENYSEILDGVQSSLSEENVRALAYNKALETVTATVKSSEAIIKSQVEAAVKEQVLTGVLAKIGLELTAEQYNAAAAAGQIDAETQAKINDAIEQQMASDQIQATITTKVEETINNLVTENMKSSEVTSQIEEAVKSAASGAGAITELKTQLDSYNQFYQGVVSYTSGVDSASSGSTKLVAGSGQLKSGSSQLAKGSKALKKGTKTLKNGVVELKKGTSQLKSGSIALVEGAEKLVTGTGTLIGGVKQLDAGALKLSDGLKQYKKEGVQKLVDAVNGDAKLLLDRFKAITKASRDYKSFTGLGDGMDGKVEFIYKTDSIQEASDKKSDDE